LISLGERRCGLTTTKEWVRAQIDKKLQTTANMGITNRLS